MKNKFIQHIVVVGGGTAGWIAAASLAKILHNRGVRITLVESPEINIIGVGESTLPQVMQFLRNLGIDEKEFMAATQATYKLGTKFFDWSEVGEAFWHPFGNIGVNIDGHNFFAFLQKARKQGDPAQMWQYAPSAVLGEAGRYYSPGAATPESFLSGVNYALHFDAVKVAKYLKRFSEALGIQHVMETVVDASLHDNGFIDSLTLKDGRRLAGDFYIDCTGTNALLIGKVLNTQYLNWNNYLLCDSAVIVQSDNSYDIPPYTKAIAHENGWRWEIPLRHRLGNGYVYSSEFCTPNQAENKLLEQVQNPALDSLRHFQFQAGRREKLWNKNCLALGFAGGFLEPLESTAIYLSLKGIESFLELYPDNQCSLAIANEFNRRMAIEYENIRDFIILHYCISGRSDSPFWQKNKTMDVPRALLEKIALYQAQGRIYRNDLDLFKSSSWHAVFDGMGIVPDFYNPLIEGSNFKEVLNILSEVRGLMSKMAAGLPAHREYLDKHCPV
ncbi:tryptophan halogenase family protein [Teredinibacter turnerae]|uniref:tryptophan halogenase family protein n=1 Tax=Teredinibacter turnerae TaxID=2426 RepID=UPI000365DFFA|nr:tryptophan halogenase family protein [Teredinibacter turnerae]